MAMTALDYEEIRQLQARYNFALDFGDAAAFGDCFTPDGSLWERAMPPGLQTELRLQGRPSLGGFATDFFANHSGHLRHWTSSSVIDGDGQNATGLSSLMVLRVGWAPYTGVILSGINRDRYTKVDDRWYIVGRELVADPQPENRNIASHNFLVNRFDNFIAGRPIG